RFFLALAATLPLNSRSSGVTRPHPEDSNMRAFLYMLAVAAGAVAIAVLPSGPEQAEGGKKAPAIRVRKNITSLNAKSPEIVAFKKAIEKMKELNTKDPADARGWAAQAKVHGTAAQGFLDCKHGSWQFFPWHRAYLFYFEEI